MREIGNVQPPPKRKQHSANTEQPPPHKRPRRDGESDAENVTREPCPWSNRFSAFTSPPLRKHREEQPSSREWAFSPCSSSSSTHRDKLVIVSYNILGVENASNHPDLYRRVSPKYLEWTRRRRLIRKEIKCYNASILCLQEVDRFNDIAHRFEKDGFEGVYKARTGEAKDGCAMFWKKAMFSLLDQEHIEFQSFGLRHNVAQLCVLKSNPNQSESDTPPQTTSCTQSRSLVIGNIHVLFNPNRGDIKLGQVRLFLEKAYQLSQKWGNIPVILSGDFNSTPQSPMYQFLTSSELDFRLHNCSHISGALRWQKERESRISRYVSRPLSYRWSAAAVRLATGGKIATRLQHQLNLSSAYLGVPGSWRTRDIIGEPLATSYHSKFMGTCDYIWHTDELVPVRVLETLPVNILKRDGGLPSKTWGSDHLALACELAFVDNSSAV